MLERLTPLDGSFLRVETENAHMHVAWSALLGPREDGTALSIEALRRSVEARLERTPRFRRRLAFSLPGMGEPFWVDDETFDVDRHVVPLCDPDDRPDRRRFHALCDRALSEPLDRTRPLWRVYLAPQLADGGAGMVAKFHHALVDGKSAVEVALLLFDVTPGGDSAPAAAWRPEPEPGTARLALGALSGGARTYDTVRRAALTVGDDLLRPAPASYLNVPIRGAHGSRQPHLTRVRGPARAPEHPRLEAGGGAPRHVGVQGLGPPGGR